jgi:hypothetical protein
MMADLNSRGLANFLISAARAGFVIACAVVGANWESSASAAKRHEYTFNGGNANDSVGTAHGTLEGGATVSVGQLNLGGAGAYVNLPAGTIGLNNYTATTLEAWFTNNNTADWQRVFDFGTSNTATPPECAFCFFFSPSIGGTGFRAAISNTDPGFMSEAQASGAGDLPANTQHYIAVTVDDTSISLYRDGQLVQSTMLAAAPQTGTVGAPSLAQVDPSLAYLGRSLYANDAFFTGTINQFTIHDNVLTPAQIQANFTAGPSGPKGPTLQINRDSGAMTLINEQTGVNIVGYTITSVAGSLDQTGWRPIANFYDSNSGGSFDNDDNWTVLTQAGSKTDLSEFEFDGGMGGVLGAGGTTALQLSTGGLWRKSIYEDVQIVAKLADGGNLPVALEYVGNGGVAFRRSDFNFDGNINLNDWNIFLANNGTNLSTLSDAESYARGDLNGDQLSNHADFRLFKADFNAANGAGAFEALASVPEPATIALLIVGSIALLPTSRSRKGCTRSVSN